MDWSYIKAIKDWTKWETTSSNRMRISIGLALQRVSFVPFRLHSLMAVVNSHHSHSSSSSSRNSSKFTFMQNEIKYYNYFLNLINNRHHDFKLISRRGKKIVLSLNVIVWRSIYAFAMAVQRWLCDYFAF